MAKAADTLPGFASVARASEILHLARSSVRGLIYAGRLPSVRLGRLHYIRAADVELERRRRLGLATPAPRIARQRRRPSRAASHSSASSSPSAESRSPRPSAPIDPELRRQRASERIELVRQWAQHHPGFDPHVPATVREVEFPITCGACAKQVRRGRYVEFSADPRVNLCTACARRALLEWADRRRIEAAAARQLAGSLGQPEPAPVVQPHLLVA